MPQFHLNTPPTREDVRQAVAYGYIKARKVHPFWDLDEFARGYVEAMFFTNGDTGDSRENLLNEWGVERLTKASVSNIKADCDRFQAENAASIEAAAALVPGGDGYKYGREPLDLGRMGNLFWFARQGHGVGWTDKGDAEPLQALQDASEAFGQIDVCAYRGWIHV